MNATQPQSYETALAIHEENNARLSILVNHLNALKGAISRANSASRKAKLNAEFLAVSAEVRDAQVVCEHSYRAVIDADEA